MIYKAFLAFSLAMVGISGAQAATGSKEPFPLNAESTEQFREQAATLRADIEKGEYSDLSGSDKDRIEKRLDELDALYVKRDASGKDVDSVSTAAINANSEINSLLTGNRGDKLICEQIKRVGSNRSTKVCSTVEEREERRRVGQKFILDRALPSYYEGPDG